MSLTDYDNGMITCSLGDDGVPSYEDSCSYTCNTGYELTSSDTRTCQSDGNWSGSDDVCRRGMVSYFWTLLYCYCLYYTYVIVVTRAQGICLICMLEARGPQARGLRAYISGKSRVPIL